jgi:hypothetical protein
LLTNGQHFPVLTSAFCTLPYFSITILANTALDHHGSS